MDTLTSKPQEQSGMPPGKAFWKALAMVGITSLVVWSAIWILVGFREGFQGGEWFPGVILFSFTVLFLTPLLYYNYRRGPKGRNISRRANILLGICYVGMAAGQVIDVLQWPARHNLRFELVLVIIWFVLAGIHFYRTFKPEDPSSLQL